jgi:aminoglycoside 3-N-acetyltransferase I
MEIEINIIQTNELEDLKTLISIFEEVFELEDFIMPNDLHLQKLLNKETFLALTAKTESRIIGGLTVFVLDQYYSARPLAYLYDLAVETESQRKGVGKKLIEFTVQYCKENGFEAVFVQAEQEDNHAVDFYRSTKFSSEIQAVQFEYDLTSL